MDAKKGELAAFDEWFRGEQGKPYIFGYEIALAAWQARAALAQPAHENGGQESEAGAVAEVAYKDAPARIWLNLGDCTAEEIAANNAGWKGLTEITWCESKMDQFDIPYVRADFAPPSDPAIEAAAIMKCAEVADRKQKFAEDILESDDIGEEEADAWKAEAFTCKTIANTIRALIPQDGQTALEEFGMKVAEQVAKNSQDGSLWDSELRTIVTNLIGVPPLSSNARGEKV